MTRTQVPNTQRQPTNGETRGLLQRRPVESAPVLTDLIGKEGNQLDQRGTGLTINPDDYRNTYSARSDRWTQLVLPILKKMGVDDIRRRAGRQKSAMYNALAGGFKERGAPSARYRDAAVQYAAGS